MAAAPYYQLIALFVSFILLISLPESEAGTWLSFNQKTGGIDAEALIPQRSVSTMRALDDGDLMKLIKVCNDQYRKRVSRRSTNNSEYFTRQERRDAEMCRSVLELVSRR